MTIKLHPTCGLVSLQRSSKLIAFLDMVLGLIGIIWFVYMMGRYDIISLDPFERPGKSTKLDGLGSVDSTSTTENPHPNSNTTDTKVVLSNNHKAISLTLSSLFTIINLSVFVILLVGAHKKSIGLCLTWFYIRCAVIVFKIMIFIMYVIAGRPLFSQIPYMLFVIIHIYGLWVVNSYIEELRGINYEKDKLGGGIPSGCHGQGVEIDDEDGQESFDMKRQRSASEVTVNGIEKLQKKRVEMYQKHNLQ